MAAVFGDVGEDLSVDTDAAFPAVETFGIEDPAAGIEPQLRAVGQCDFPGLPKCGIGFKPLGLHRRTQIGQQRRDNQGGCGGETRDAQQTPRTTVCFVGCCGKQHFETPADALQSRCVGFGGRGVEQPAEHGVVFRFGDMLPQPVFGVTTLLGGAFSLHIAQQLFFYLFLGFHNSVFIGGL